MKRIFLIAAMCYVCAGAQADDFKWKRDAMNGSRTGVTVPKAVVVQDALGTVKGCTYYAPNGKIYRKGSVVKAAGLVIKAQPVMAPVKEIVGHSAKVMTKYAPESPLSNFFADLLIIQTERISGKKVDVSLANFGGIRVDMPAGEIIVDDIMSMFPFRNDVVYLTIKGSQLREIFEGMAARSFQVLGGVRVVAEDRKLVSVEIGGEPLDDDKVYGMATISFLLDGGDGISLRQRVLEVIQYPVSIYEAVMAYIKAETEAGRVLDADVDGRVVVR